MRNTLVDAIDELTEAGVKPITYTKSQADHLFTYSQEYCDPKSKLYSQLTDQKYDIIFTEYQRKHLEFVECIQKDVPVYIILTSFMEVQKSVMFGTNVPGLSHYVLHKHWIFEPSIDNLDRLSLVNRLKNLVTILRTNNINENWLFEKEHEKHHNKFLINPKLYSISTAERYPDLVLAGNIVGLVSELMPIAPNMKFIRHKETQLVGDQQLPPAVKHFYDQYDRLIYCSKGSASPFNKNDLQNMLTAAQVYKDYGFLISLSNLNRLNFDEETLSLLEQQKNVLIQKFVNQPLVLSNPQTFIHITAGGMNSLAESFSYGNELIITCLGQDTFLNCELQQSKGTAECILPKSGKTITQGISNIIKKYKTKEQQAERQLFKQRCIENAKFYDENEENILFWVDYSQEVGLQHLAPKYIWNMNTAERFDADIKQTFILVIVIALFIIFRFLKGVLSSLY
eukprot:403352437